MKKNSAFFSHFFYWLKMVITGLVLGFILQFARAWLEPGQSPPGGNLGAPLNTGNLGQYKVGGLVLNTGGALNGLIVQNGNVGIGTTSPGASLEIKGTTKIFGAWDATKTYNTVYRADTDGFVICYVRCITDARADVDGITDSGNPPTAIRTMVSANRNTQTDLNNYNMMFPVRKGDYWKVNVTFIGGGTINIYVNWIPLGN